MVVCSYLAQFWSLPASQMGMGIFGSFRTDNSKWLWFRPRVTHANFSNWSSAHPAPVFDIPTLTFRLLDVQAALFGYVSTGTS